MAWEKLKACLRTSWSKLQVEPAKLQPSKREIFSTGSNRLDHALSLGGLRAGEMVEIFGPPSSGKSTLSLQITASIQRQGGSVALMDIERSLDPGYARSLGVKTETLLLLRPESWEQTLGIALQLLASEALQLLIIDTLSALPLQSELGRSLEQGEHPDRIQQMVQGIKALRRCAARVGALLIILNQGCEGARQERSPGGFYFGLRLRLAEPPSRSQIQVQIIKERRASTGRLAVVAKSITLELGET